MRQEKVTDNLAQLLDVLPPSIRECLEKQPDLEDLLEIVMDLGRPAEARFPTRSLELSDIEITPEDIEYIVSRVGEFGKDNRAGIERTLHRISAIRNRQFKIVGLTCRIGRAVYGTIDIIRDVVESGKSILMLGRPGVGKTTKLREVARVLSDEFKKRVVIVDTSNEIAGDGDIPHPAIGHARRMQVAKPSLQHEVMIEAVENHNPEVIVIDEIGRELEALAARTIAERGVQLVATAHWRTLENLLLNPTLSDLVGGIESVTLSDEEARRRGTQKTVLERRSPPTFDVLVEIQERDRMAVHADVAAAVDALLRGYPLPPEIRTRSEDGEIKIEKPAPTQAVARQARGGRRGTGDAMGGSGPLRTTQNYEEVREIRREDQPNEDAVQATALRTVRVFPYGVARNRLMQAAKRLGVPVFVVRELEEADVVMTLRAYYRAREQAIVEAEERGLQIYALRANTIAQMEQSLASLFNLPEDSPLSSDLDTAAIQMQNAIQAVLGGQRFVDLPPASAAIRRMQHEMARQAQLVSHSYGKEPNRRVRIFRD